jgi:DNA-binding MarR family transcriptional regulator
MKEDPPKAKSKRLLQLSEDVSRIAGSLAQLSIGPGPLRQDYPCSNLNESEVPLDRVDWLIAARRKRALYLSSDLFAEPAWDILLDLLRAELAHEQICVSSASIASGIPASTGLRWLKALEQRGLVVRECDPDDARRYFVRLSADASRALRRYFLEVVGAASPGE